MNDFNKFDIRINRELSNFKYPEKVLDWFINNIISIRFDNTEFFELEYYLTNDGENFPHGDINVFQDTYFNYIKRIMNSKNYICDSPLIDYHCNYDVPYPELNKIQPFNKYDTFDLLINTRIRDNKGILVKQINLSNVVLYGIEVTEKSATLAYDKVSGFDKVFNVKLKCRFNATGLYVEPLPVATPDMYSNGNNQILPNFSKDMDGGICLF